MLSLYTYYRSSAAYRVRIGLELKGLSYLAIPLHLVRSGGEQHLPGYRSVNPQGLVPSLDHDGHVMTQSLAILEYLDERYPAPHLMPADPAARARVRAIALLVACDIHPLNNLRVLHYLKDAMAIDDAARAKWYQHWVQSGFQALESLLAGDGSSGHFCEGKAPTLADCCLVPQVYNALRFDCPLSEFPRIGQIYASCMALGAFQRAAPENQPDAE